MGTVRGGVLAVDTAELDELCRRLRSTADALADSTAGRHGLQGLGGLAVGADAVLDALSDLARQWDGHATSLASDAVGLGLLVERARSAYDGCEGRVTGLVCVRGPAGDAR